MGNFFLTACPLNGELLFDGLSVEWGTSNFCNPPYDRVNKPLFIKKGFEEWKKGKTVVFLLPTSTGTKQFHELILPHAEIRFVKGRISFHGFNTKGEYSTKNKGKHDSMIVIFRAKN
jgi:DNA N-6-adenine-methyltransferase (Dam)